MRRILLMLTAIALGCPGLAHAVNNTINSATPVALGELHSQTMNAGDFAYFGFLARAGRSYAAACWVPTADGSVRPGVISSGCTISFRNNSDIPVPALEMTGLSAEPSVGNGEVVGWVATATSSFFVRVNSAASGTMRVLIVETTLFAPWYFVSVESGYEAFVEIKNNTSVSISVTVSALTPGGNAAGSGAKTITLAANGNIAIAVGATFGITTGNGGLQIASNAAPGGVTANVTTLSTMTGLSFDSPAAPRMVWSLFQ
jgi:hypothetical protein